MKRLGTTLVLVGLMIQFAGAQATEQTPAPAPQPTKPPLGWLSDPTQPPSDILQALISGKIHLDNNFRIELADTTDRDSSTAITNRLRLGYQTKPFHGFSAFAEMEGVIAADRDNYWVPATGDGDPSRTTVADPTGIEVNQAYGRYNVESLADTGISLDVIAGRQRITLDDHRFIGNVGWRQFEQTFDAVSLSSNLGVKDFKLFYAYLWNIEKIFGPDGPDAQSDSHLFNATYRFFPELATTAFAYLLDFGADDPLNSSNSFGLRLTGDILKDKDDAQDFFLDYELTYARQLDAGDNTVDYEADFIAVQLRATRKQLGHALIGYQMLGSDDGMFAFRFPLGTNHKFQGFADNFLVTPASGLHDLHAALGADLPLDIKAQVIVHQFWSEEDGANLGEEVDFVISKQLKPWWSVLAKGAFYDGDSGNPDTTRVWFQTTVKF